MIPDTFNTNSSSHLKSDSKVEPSNSADVPLLETRNITKDYSGFIALDNIDFKLNPKEVHVLFGENGAGKSTLISILAGAQTPSSGDVYFNGDIINLSNVHRARELGISAVFQEFSLVPQMTVAENIFLGFEWTKFGLINKKASRKYTQDILEELEFNAIKPDQTIDSLTRAEQQMVEIAKAYNSTRSKLSVLILDEPTASLTHHETEQLFKLINRLKVLGIGIIYITHRMFEIKEIGDVVTVLRDGKFIAKVDAKSTSEDELVQLMSGRVIEQLYPKINFKPGEEILRVEGLQTTKRFVKEASFTARRGEIVGMAGLVGSGKSTALKACFGIDSIRKGTVTFKNKLINNNSPKNNIEEGFFYLPPNRRDDGLMMVRNARENISLASISQPPISKKYWLNKRAELKMCDQLADRFDLSPRNLKLNAESFSGGNQQKLMIARSVTRHFDLIVFDEPTVGVDVGTRAIIYEFIAQLCENGTSVILVSSDMSEVIHLSHRVYVFYGGKIQTELQGKDISEANLLSNFFEKEKVL